MREISNHSLYKDKKGNLYYVIGLAALKENYKLMVVYHELWGDNEMFVVPLDEFEFVEVE